MSSFSFKYPLKAHTGHNVSHAKNRTKRQFRYNLRTVTVIVDGIKSKLKVPAKVVRQLKNSGVTTHYKNIVKKAD